MQKQDTSEIKLSNPSDLPQIITLGKGNWRCLKRERLYDMLLSLAKWICKKNKEIDPGDVSDVYHFYSFLVKVFNTLNIEKNDAVQVALILKRFFNNQSIIGVDTDIILYSVYLSEMIVSDFVFSKEVFVNLFRGDNWTEFIRRCILYFQLTGMCIYYNENEYNDTFDDIFVKSYKALLQKPMNFIEKKKLLIRLEFENQEN